MPTKIPSTLAGGEFLLDLVQVAIVALDRRGHVSLINKKGSEILGYEAAEIVGKDWFRAFLPERVRETVEDLYRRLMRGEAAPVEYFENPVLTRSGEERVIAWHNSVLRDKSGRPSGTLSSGQDITERRQAEASLQRTERNLQDMKYALDQAAIVAITDQRGSIRYVNDNFCEISKYSREELLNQDHRIVNSGYHPKEYIRTLWRTIGGGRIWRGEIRNRAKDGTIYWVDTTIVPFLDERGKPYQYLAIRSDITDRKRAEEELRKRDALARLGQMAAVVAHEVKNPLAGIGGAIQIIGNRLPRESPDREVVGSILERIDALNRKVEDLLAFSRPRPPRFAQVPLYGLLQETTEFLSKDPKLAGVDVVISPTAVVLSADAHLLREVFVNLLFNAAQAMDGRGRIDVSTRSRGGECRIEVRDDGPGVHPDVRERIFEPFFSTSHSGTGLGLAIAQRVVEDHGGTISLDCPPSGGTVVSVNLPVQQPVQQPA